MGRFAVAVLAVLSVGCGVDSVADVTDESVDDGVELSASELNASLILPFVNDRATTYALLTAAVGVEARASKNIIDARDAKPFTTIAELDAVPYVGPAALAKLDQYAVAHFGGGATSTTVDGVSFTPDEAKAALAAVNGSDLTQLGLSATATKNLLAARPFTTIAQVGAVAYVGTTAMTAIRAWAVAHPITPTPPIARCTAAGGTFDGVSFTAAEDCHALEFLSKARVSEMRDMPNAGQYAAMSGTWDANGWRTHSWTSVRDFSSLAGVGTTAMNALKTNAARWAPNGLGYDTIANTWANRSTLVGAPVSMPKVYVTKLLPETSFGGYRMQCAELRDAPAATNYFIGCYPAIWCSASGTEPCWPMGANAWASVYGSFRTSSNPGFGGYLLYLTTSAVASRIP